MEKGSKLLSALASLLTALFSLSAALALPMLWRGWYYLQIDALALPAKTGWSPAVIREAFDEVMDFLMFDAPFGTGQLAWSTDGMAHFADCKFLFRLDLVIFTITGALMLWLIFSLLFFPGFHKKFSVSPPFLALIFTLVVLLFFGIWAFVDFDGLFTAFHALCFPGKTNWIFDYRTDQIILILPEEFWAYTAGLVSLAALGIESVLSLLLALFRKATQPKSVYDELRRLA